MSEGGKVASLHITMKKHPGSLYPIKGTPEFDKNEVGMIMGSKKSIGTNTTNQRPVFGEDKQFELFPEKYFYFLTLGLRY